MLRINWITVSIFWHQWNMFKTILYHRSKYVVQYSFTLRNAINQKTLLFHYLQFNFFKVYDACIFVRRIKILWVFLTVTVLNFCAEQTSVPNDYDRCTLFHWHGKWLERRIYDDDTWSTLPSRSTNSRRLLDRYRLYFGTKTNACREAGS